MSESKILERSEAENLERQNWESDILPPTSQTCFYIIICVNVKNKTVFFKKIPSSHQSFWFVAMEVTFILKIVFPGVLTKSLNSTSSQI